MSSAPHCDRAAPPCLALAAVYALASAYTMGLRPRPLIEDVGRNVMTNENETYQEHPARRSATTVTNRNMNHPGISGGSDS